MKYKTEKLTQVFKPTRGNSSYTKAYGVKHPGAYPVYSAAIEPLTHIDHFDYDGTYITWNTNGFGGYVSVLAGKFSVNGDRGILIPLVEGVDLNYAAQVLQGDLRKVAKGRLGDRGKNEFTKVSLDTIQKVFITIPIKSDGSYDLAVQEQIASDFRKVRELKKYIESQARDLKAAKLDIPVTGKFDSVAVENIFDLDQSTNSSSFTKKFVNQHSGDIPVYSASSDEDLVGYGYVADNLPGIKYFENILTWNIDGSVGKAIFREGRFSLSEKVIPLIPKPEWAEKINYDYIRFALEEKAAERGFGYSNKAGKSRIGEIELQVPDIDTQKEIASRYADAYGLKDELVEDLMRLTNLEVTFTPR